MGKASHRRHDISDKVWELLAPHLPGRKGGLTQKYTWPWMRMVCQSELLLRKVPLMTALKQVS